MIWGFSSKINVRGGDIMGEKIGVIGSGVVGQTLAKGFAAHGYEVMIGTNTPSKQKELAEKTGKGIGVGSFEETARFGELLVLAVKGHAALAAIDRAGADNFQGKVVLDTTNPIADAPHVNGVLRFTTTLERSLMEELQAAVPGARFVKVFSSVGSKLMVNPKLSGGPPSMFICGNDDDAKGVTREILEKFGWETEDMGKIEAARAIEPLSILWCIPGFLGNGWMHAFKVLRP
jgi:predicted dinucleotide-binding enzyme